MLRATIGAALSLAFVVAAVAPAAAEPIAVRYTEGITRGFPVLRSLGGDKLAQGELTQVPRGDAATGTGAEGVGLVVDQQPGEGQGDDRQVRAPVLDRRGHTLRHRAPQRQRRHRR